MDEDQAALDVLGVSYNDLGIGIAKSWNFPDSLIAGMKKIEGDKTIQPSTDVDRMNVAVNMANDLCPVASVTDAKTRTKHCKKSQRAIRVSWTLPKKNFPPPWHLACRSLPNVQN